MIKIHCETVGHEDFVIAEGIDYDDAAEIAIYEKDADYHPEAGVWTCSACYDAYMAEGMREAVAYCRDLERRRLQEDHDNYIDSILSGADAIRDCGV
jgi:hypothetical protein